MSNYQNEDLCREAIDALEKGSKIEAIKITREQDNSGLKEAKDKVEIYLENNSVVNDRLQQNASRSGGIFLVLIMCAIGIIYGFYRFGLF